ncbi:inositol phosphosphingolipids phospholipase C [Monosporozyma servazzii]
MSTEAEREVKFLTFNTWGLKYVSKHRKQRLHAIADKLSGMKASSSKVKSLNECVAGTSMLRPINDDLFPEGEGEIEYDFDIIALQEIWCKEDWDYLIEKCGKKYPYSRIFYSGILTGPGLAILSKIPIESSFLYRFPINGRPSAVLNGDWYVGKSIAITKLRPIGINTPPIVVMNSHMHAPYALTGDAAYECHRAAQAWDFSNMINLYKQAGYAVIVVGDLNSRPGSLQHNLLTQETGLTDSWEQLHGETDLEELKVLNALDQLKVGCTTCDSLLNTWRAKRQPEEACRLDYALLDASRLQTVEAGVRFTDRIDGVGSFSDHFAYYCKLKILTQEETVATVVQDSNKERELKLNRYSNYEELLKCIEDYKSTARKQKNFRGLHFIVSILLLIISMVVTSFTSMKASWSSVFWVFFAILISVTGLIDGQISFLFGRSEIRGLMEVQNEVQDAQKYLQTILDA